MLRGRRILSNPHTHVNQPTTLGPPGGKTFFLCERTIHTNPVVSAHSAGTDDSPKTRLQHPTVYPTALDPQVQGALRRSRPTKETNGILKQLPATGVWIILAPLIKHPTDHEWQSCHAPQWWSDAMRVHMR